MKSINWKLSKRDQEIVSKIVQRGMKVLDAAGIVTNAQNLEMDIIATHRIIGLRLLDLVTADDFNFAHDVFGIVKNLDREAIEMRGYFVPRFAARKKGDLAPPVASAA